MPLRTDELVEKLRVLGLAENEARAYLAVVKLGTCRAGDIALKASLQRTEIYRIMSRLVSLGLIEESISRPRQYRASRISSALPRLSGRVADKLRVSSKVARELAVKLVAPALKYREEVEQEVRVIYGARPARDHLLESVEHARRDLWGIAGPKRPTHLSDRFWARVLKRIAERKLPARFIVTVNKENLHRVRRIAHVLDVRHYQEAPFFMYGFDDRSVALSLSKEPIKDPSQTAQLVVTYPPSVSAIRQFFDIVWSEATPFSIREHLLLGTRPAGQDTRVIRGREEFRALVESYSEGAKEWIGDYLSTRYGPTRLLAGFKEYYVKARKRGVKIQLICHLSKDNAEAVKELASLFEVRHKENPIGFDITVIDESDAIIHHVDPDRPDPAPGRSTYTIHITRKEGVMRLDDLFRQLWEDSVPIEQALHRIGQAKTP